MRKQSMIGAVTLAVAVGGPDPMPLMRTINTQALMVDPQSGRYKRAQEDLRRAEDTKALAEEDLRDADRRKDEVLAMLAHELRKPAGSHSNALSRPPMSGETNTWTAPITSSNGRRT